MKPSYLYKYKFTETRKVFLDTKLFLNIEYKPSVFVRFLEFVIKENAQKNISV